MYSDKEFYIQRESGDYLDRRDLWNEKLYAKRYKSLADVRHDILRLRDYLPERYAQVSGCSNDEGRWYPLEELFR